MKNKNYYNQDGDLLYVLHFPGNGISGHRYIINDNLSRRINVSDDISIISIMNQKCWEESLIRQQCEYNHIRLYNTALNETEWDNTLKINHILKTLEQIDTKYCLILDGRDTVICSDLDETFIHKYQSFGIPVIYNGTPAPYPNVVIESLQELTAIKGKQKYINAGVCIGDTASLREFYLYASEIKKKYPDNKSEQFIIRKTKKRYPHIAGHDYDNRIFRIVHQYDTRIKEADDGGLILI